MNRNAANSIRLSQPLFPRERMVLKLGLTTAILAMAIFAAEAATTIFTDTFGSSTTNQVSTPGGTPSASSTSYDIASTKDGRTCTIAANQLRLKLASATTAGYMEIQAIFSSTPVQLVNIGDSINMTIIFTNSAGTLLAGGDKSMIDVGLYNSGGAAPVSGAGIVNAGLSTSLTTFTNANCKNWQGYVGKLNCNGFANAIYTRPIQGALNNANQDVVFSGAGGGLYQTPAGTTIGSTATSAAALTSGATYTRSFTILLSATNQVTITDELYAGTVASGVPISSLVRTTSGGTTYTNMSNQFDALAIGIANSGTSFNPQMDISKITIKTDSYAAPTITGLTNFTAIAGNNVTLSPTVTGNPTPAYQWYLSTDGGVSSNIVSGATNAALTLTNVQSSQDGYQYSLYVTNVVGTNVATMMLSVIVTPSITGLNDQAALVGDTVTIAPTVVGLPAPTLQWQSNGVNMVDGPTGSGSIIAGSTSSTLYITNVQTADTALYSLIASNTAGIVTNSMHLTVATSNILPVVTGPTNITVIQGNNGTFSASATAVPLPTLQWLDQTGTPIPGATGNTLTLTNVQYSQNGYVYSFVASNSVGSVTNSATLTVIVPPAITLQPTNLVVTNTQSASFTVVATGVPTPGYQWNKNGSPISGATSATYTIGNAAPSDIGTYSCTITNQAGTTNTVSVTLTVNSTMSVVSVSPTNAQTAVCYDTPLYITLSSAPTMRTNGTIKIFAITNNTTPVDTINLALNSTLGVQAHTAFTGDGQTFNYYPVVITGNTVAIYPHAGVMNSNQTYYVTIDDGAFADGAGAYFAGVVTNAWQFTTKPTGPANPVNPIVAANGSGDFVTVQGAVDSLPVNAAGALRTINIRNGTYFEIVNVGKTNVTLRGQSQSGTVIKYPNNATIAPGGTTHARMTFKVTVSDVAIDNLTITNSTPQGGSQAEALMIESSAKHCIVNNCEIDSRQDTILANVNSSQAYFYNSKITGNFDYIWGGGNLFFQNCEIRTISGASGFNLTAARTDTSATQSSSFPWANPGGTFTANGMSFVNCTFTADSGVGSITLAGSNGTAANNVSWYGCDFATNYVTPSASLFSGNYVFWQAQNTMTNTPVTFATLTTISGADARLLAATNLNTWFYGWNPALAPNITGQPVNQTVTAGQTASFSVTATGIPSASYQWLQNGTNAPYPTANSATLMITNAQAADATNYAVIVSNASGSVTSSVVSLTVIVPAAPVTDSSSLQKLNDGNIQFSFSGTQSASYRIWATTNVVLTPITSTWTLVGSGTFGASPVSFTDSNATNYPQRFYIISSP